MLRGLALTGLAAIQITDICSVYCITSKQGRVIIQGLVFKIRQPDMTPGGDHIPIAAYRNLVRQCPNNGVTV